MLNDLVPQEDARIEKADGNIVGPYKASFAGSTIFITDEKADLEEGDTILRELPNGKDERSVVTEATLYRKGIGGMGAHYQVKFRKGGQAPSQTPTQNINISGNSSVQIGNHNTQNIINAFDSLVKEIESTDASNDEKQEAKSRLKEFLEHPLVVAVLGTAAGSIVV